MNQRNGFANVVLVFAPFIFGGAFFVVSWLEGHWRGSAIVYAASITVLGFAAFALAKVSLFAKGNWLSFGSGYMRTGMRRLYHWGYVCMGWGLVSLTLVVVVRAF